MKGTRQDVATPPRSVLVALLSLLFLFPFSGIAQENSVRVAFENDPSQSTVIGAFRQKGILFGSLTDMTQVFGLQSYTNTQMRKIELKHGSFRIKVSGDNPYVVVSEIGGQQNIHHLQHSAIFAAESYFVPLHGFLPIMEKVMRTPFALDAAGNVLRVGRAIPTPAAFDIPAVSFEPKLNGMVIRIKAERGFDEFESWLKQDGWLYVTVSGARANVKTINSTQPVGMVKKIVAIQSPTSVQLTFKLSGKIAASEILRDPASNDILVSLRMEGAEDKILLEQKKNEIFANLEAHRKRWVMDVVVLDAGHGGKDPGARGVTGTLEKDVTLGITLKLGRLIERNLRDVKVVYTRKDDRFIELDRRGQIANEANGKLFVSIHANSMPRKPHPMRGFEVYLLRPGRSAEAVAIAERENSVIQFEEGYEKRYKELTDENFILVTMAQSAHVKASETFADLCQQEMHRVGGLPNRGVKQAGFYVLVGASMPNVLVETAYLSNRDDERILRAESGQHQIADAIFQAIRRYKEEHEKLLLEGKDLGERR